MRVCAVLLTLPLGRIDNSLLTIERVLEFYAGPRGSALQHGFIPDVAADDTQCTV
jgi:hypothetical protein